MEGLTVHVQLSRWVGSKATKHKLRADVVIGISGTSIEERAPDVRAPAKARVCGTRRFLDAANDEVELDRLDRLGICEAHERRPALQPAVAVSEAKVAMCKVKAFIPNFTNAFHFQSAPRVTQGIRPTGGIEKLVIKVVVEGGGLSHAVQCDEQC